MFESTGGPIRCVPSIVLIASSHGDQNDVRIGTRGNKSMKTAKHHGYLSPMWFGRTCCDSMLAHRRCKIGVEHTHGPPHASGWGGGDEKRLREGDKDGTPEYWVSQKGRLSQILTSMMSRCASNGT